MPFQRTIGPLEMTLLDFRTDSGNKNQYVFSGITDGGERFSWKGFFYLDPLRSEGEFSLDGVSLAKYAPLYQDLFRFEIKDGVINLHSTYRYERSAATHLLAVTNTTFALESLKVVEKETGQTVAEASSFVVTGASVDAMARQAEAGTVTVTDGRLLLRRNKDTSVNAIELSKPAEAAPNTPGGILLLLRAMTNVVAMLLNSTNLSNGTIGELHLHNCALHLEDLVNSQPVRLDLDRIEVHGKNISNRAGTNMTAEVSLRWDTNGTVRAGHQGGPFTSQRGGEAGVRSIESAAAGPLPGTPPGCFRVGQQAGPGRHGPLAQLQGWSCPKSVSRETPGWTSSRPPRASPPRVCSSGIRCGCPALKPTSIRRLSR